MLGCIPRKEAASLGRRPSSLNASCRGRPKAAPFARCRSQTVSRQAPSDESYPAPPHRSYAIACQHRRAAPLRPACCSSARWPIPRLPILDRCTNLGSFVTQARDLPPRTKTSDCDGRRRDMVRIDRRVRLGGRTGRAPRLCALLVCAASSSRRLCSGLAGHPEGCRRPASRHRAGRGWHRSGSRADIGISGPPCWPTPGGARPITVVVKFVLGPDELPYVVSRET